MATNIRHETGAAVRMQLAVGASQTSGSVIHLNDMPVLLLEASDSDDNAVCELIGVTTVVDLSVIGANGAGNVAVAVGDVIFKDGAAYNKDATNGRPIGYALEAVTSGSTSTIKVGLVGSAAKVAKTVAGATFTVGAEGTNAINVAIQLTDAAGDALAEAVALPFYLATDSAGLNASGTAPDGGIAIGTDGSLIEWTANLSGLAISEADGDIDITLTESAGATWYLVLVLPDGSLAVSGAITFAA